jgi:peptidoglycan/LPS O-acetylase OafA/YrhL
MSGGVGVSFFFVLSGFLITYLIIKEIEETNKLNIKYFYIRRTLRIWPLFFFVVFFGFFVYPIFKKIIGMDTNLPNQIWYHISFLSNFDSIYIAQNKLQATSPMMVGITWSVSIEEQFYLVWPLLFMVYPKKWYPLIFIKVIVISSLFRYFNRADSDVIYYHTLSVMSNLAVGGLFAYYSLNSSLFLRTITQMKKWLIILIYVFGLSIMFYGNYIYPSIYDVVFMPILSALFFGFIILEQNFAQNSLFKYGRLKYLSILGKYTYGLYLLHPIAIQVMIITYKLLKITPDGFPIGLPQTIIYSTGAFAISLIISWLSYHYLEIYFLKLKDKFTTATISTQKTKI